MTVGAILGRYRLVEKLGQGGMATVYRAEDAALGRQVAVKVMHPFIAERSEAGRRFEREARAAAALKHRNVLLVHDYAPATGEAPAYLVSELLSGPTLQRFLVEHGAPLAEVAAMLALCVAEALQAAHAQGIVHRDVKPENVIFDVRGSARVVLCDFGIAQVAAAGGVTATGTLLGSPAYMSPEQAAGAPVDARSDQFSLGALLYELVTGRPPFAGATPLAIMAAIAKGAYTPPSAKNPRLPVYVERVIARLLQPKPEARFVAIADAADGLRAGLAGDGFADVDAELTAYLAAPAEYNAAVEPRVVAAALAEADRALGRGEKARALAAAARVLAWQPDHARAVALVGRLSSRPRRFYLAAAALMAPVAAAAAFALATFGAPVAELTPPSAAVTATPPPQPIESTLPPPKSSPPPKRAASVPAPDPAPAPDPVPVSVPVPDHVPVPVPAPVPDRGRDPVADATRPATLVLAVAPPCDVTIDGAARGRTPQTLALPPGRHHLTCVNAASSRRLERDLELAPGERRQLRERLFAEARLAARFSRCDRFSADDGAPTAGPIELAPGRHRVSAFSAGVAVETRWLDVPPGGCVLVDVPRLECRKP